jgi:hypothetical protein
MFNFFYLLNWEKTDSYFIFKLEVFKKLLRKFIKVINKGDFKMNNLKIISLVSVITTLFFPDALMASTKGTSSGPTEENQNQKPTVPQKVGRETARIIGQGEDAGKEIAKSFKKQRHKDKNKDSKK